MVLKVYGGIGSFNFQIRVKYHAALPMRNRGFLFRALLRNGFSSFSIMALGLFFEELSVFSNVALVRVLVAAAFVATTVAGDSCSVVNFYVAGNRAHEQS